MINLIIMSFLTGLGLGIGFIIPCIIGYNYFLKRKRIYANDFKNIL